MRGVTTGLEYPEIQRFVISTHTPHARRDLGVRGILGQPREISTHTPHARRDQVLADKSASGRTFQLTRLMRGVTPPTGGHNPPAGHFNSHASCEA